MKTLAETLLNYYQEHEDDFNHDIEELDSLNYILGDRRVAKMDMLDEFYQGKDITEILKRAYYGYDYDSLHEENGVRIADKFNPNRDYFYSNAYGNLISTDYKDYSDYLYLDFMDNIIENEHYLVDMSDGAREIIDNYNEDGDSDEN